MKALFLNFGALFYSTHFLSFHEDYHFRFGLILLFYSGSFVWYPLNYCKNCRFLQMLDILNMRPGLQSSSLTF